MKPSDERRYEAYEEKEWEAFKRERLRKYDREAGYQSGWEIFLSIVATLWAVAFWLFKMSLAVLAGIVAFFFALIISAVKAFREARRK